MCLPIIPLCNNLQMDGSHYMPMISLSKEQSQLLDAVMVPVVAAAVDHKGLRVIVVREVPMVWEELEAVHLLMMPVEVVEVLPVAVGAEFLEEVMEIFMVVAVVPPDVLEIQVEMVEMVLPER